MNQIIQLHPQQIGILSMTSREIAELTGKEHKHVIRDIRAMLDELGHGPDLDHVHETKDLRGYTSEISLSKSLTLTLVSGYNIGMRKRIIDRWLELEAVPTFKVPTTMAGALRLAADLEEQKILLEQQITKDAPKVKFAEAVRDLDGVCKLEAIAKMLGTGRTRFFARLREDGVLLSNNLPRQQYIDRDYFRVVEREPWIDKEGKTHPTFTSMVTGRGQVWLQHKYANQKAA